MPLVLTPNVPEYLAKAAPPQAATLDICPILPTTLDYVTAPTGKSEAELDALLFDKVARRNRKDPYEERRYRGAGIEEVRAWWKSCRNWMEGYRTYGEPFVFDFKKLLKALSAKDTAAQLEVDIFMENCAKRWQTKDGTYRLKRRRLPDVRDSPGYPGADIDMEDI